MEPRTWIPSRQICQETDNWRIELTQRLTILICSVAVSLDAKKNIIILHIVSNLGGTLLWPAINIVGAVRIESNHIGVSISNGSFCKPVKLNTLGLEKYQKCESDEELAALKGSTKGKFNRSNIFMLVSCMIRTLMNVNTLEPLKLILIVIGTTNHFDDANKDEDHLALDHAEALCSKFSCGQWARGKYSQLIYLAAGQFWVAKVCYKYRIKQCLEISSITFSEDASISLNSSTNPEDQKYVLKQLTVSIASKVENTKESSKRTKRKKITWESYTQS